jgi:quinol-cytochrome oxidoreductase complex cytochrome b subunit
MLAIVSLNSSLNKGEARQKLNKISYIDFTPWKILNFHIGVSQDSELLEFYVVFFLRSTANTA